MRAGIIVEEETEIKEGKNLVPRTWQPRALRIESSEARCYRMRWEIGAVMGAAVLAVTLLPAGAQVAMPPTAEELAAISERGKMLYEYDQAAWHATDAIVTANPKTVDGQQCIARKMNGNWTVVFGKLNEDRSQFEITYEAEEQATLRDFAVRPEPEAREDQGFFLYAARAIEVAMKDFGKANRPYNVAVLPVQTEQLYVYLYPAQTTARVYPLGGDVRYLVAADGTKLLEKRQMHKTVMEVALRPGKKVASGFHTDILSDLVEDTDVFHVLTEEPPIPEFIATPHFLYQVKTDGKIELEKEKKRRK
jgi:hypothetical protein